MVTPISKHSITNDKQKQCPLKFRNKKYSHLIMINDASNNDIIVDYVINYKPEMLQLTIKTFFLVQMDG
jgi:hypothetical protein